MAIGRISGKTEQDNREIINDDLKAEGFESPEQVVKSLNQDQYSDEVRFKGEVSNSQDYLDYLENRPLNHQAVINILQDLISNGDPKFLEENLHKLENRAGFLGGRKIILERAEEFLALGMVDDFWNFFTATKFTKAYDDKLSGIKDNFIKFGELDKLDDFLNKMSYIAGAHEYISPTSVKFRADKIITGENFLKIADELCALFEATRVEIKLPPEILKKCSEAVIDSPEKISQLRLLKRMTGSELGVSKEKVTDLVSRIISDDSLWKLYDVLNDLEGIFGVELTVDQEIINKRAEKVILESNSEDPDDLDYVMRSLQLYLPLDFAIVVRPEIIVKKMEDEIATRQTFSIEEYYGILAGLFGADFTINPEIVKKVVSNIVSGDGNLDYIYNHFIFFQNLAGGDLVVDPEIAKKRAENVVETPINAQAFWNDISILQELCGYRLKISPEAAKKRAEYDVEIGESSVFNLNMRILALQELSGSNFTIDTASIKKRAEKEIERINIEYLPESLFQLRSLSKEQIDINPAIVKMRAESLIRNGSFGRLKHDSMLLSGSTNVQFSVDPKIISERVEREIIEGNSIWHDATLDFLEELAGTKFAINSEIVKVRAEKEVLNSPVESLGYRISILRALSDGKFVISPEVVEKRVKSILFNEEGYSVGFKVALDQLARATGVRPKIDSEMLKSGIEDKITTGNFIYIINKFQEFQELAGGKLVIDPETANRCIKEFSDEAGILNLKVVFDFFRKVVGNEFNISPEEANRRAEYIISHSSGVHSLLMELELLKNIAGFGLKISPVAEKRLMQEVILEVPLDQLGFRLHALQRLISNKLVINPELVDRRVENIMRNCNPLGLKRALGLLRSATGIEFTVNSGLVNREVGKLFQRPDLSTVGLDIQLIREATGIEVVVSPQIIKRCVEETLSSYYPIQRIGENLKILRELSGGELYINPKLVIESADRIVEESNIYEMIKALNALREATGVNFAVDPNKFKSRIPDLVIYGPVPTEAELKEIEDSLGVKFDFGATKEGMENRAAVARRLAREIDVATALDKIKEMEASPIGPIMEEYLSAFVESVSYPSGWADVIESAKKISEFTSRNRSRQVAISFSEKVKGHPWAEALSSLLKQQHWVSRPEYNPWETELQPLLTSIISKGYLSINNPESARELQEFCKRFGFINLPIAYRIVRDCLKSESVEDIPKESVDELSALGIDIKKFRSSAEILNALIQTARHFQEILLSDKLPAGWNSKLGKEIIGRIKGSTQWERGSNIEDLVITQERTAAKNPELLKVPSWQKSMKFEARLLERTDTKKSSKERSEEIEVFWDSEEMEDRYYIIADPLRRAFSENDPISWWNLERDNYVKSIEADRKRMEEYLAADGNWWEGAIANAKNADVRADLKKMRDRLANPKVREGMEKNVAQLRKDEEEIAALDIAEGSEKACVAILESLSSRKGGPKLQGLIKATSAIHMRRILPDATSGWRDNISTLLSKNEEVNLQQLETVADFVRQYIYEHYLNPSQDPKHVEHTPFSEDLRRKLVSLWQVQPNIKAFPIEELCDKARSLLGSGDKSEEKEPAVAVSMRPVAGLFYVLSGDVGDACYTSQHRELASGQFPDVRTWLYVSGGEKTPEVLRGSVLGIRAEEVGTKVPVLVARANNPRQNFISTVNPNDFVLGSLRTIVESARELAKENGGAAKVVVPLDGRSASCSNRQEVADVYRNRFQSCDKMALKSNPSTNFNGYNVWDKQGNHACGVVWEIVDGEEYWYGDWE